MRILCLEISEVKSDVVRPAKKGFSDCKKICADYACSYCTYPTCHAFLSMFSPYLVYGGIVLIGFAILAISASLSIKIYDKADLA